MKIKHFGAVSLILASALAFNRAGADPAAGEATGTAPSDAAELLAARLTSFKIHPHSLFYVPDEQHVANENERLLEERFWDVGVASYWRQYGQDEEIHPNDYKGYILYADPYHEGLKRISFLLGSDCSHFVQRLFQMLGAEYPYAKTRHFIHLGKAAAKSQSMATYIEEQKKRGETFDQKLCFFENLEKKFAPVQDSSETRSDGAQWKVGDVLVFPKADGVMGERGHMGLIIKTAPLALLHAHNGKEGIVETAFDPESSDTYYHFRWRADVSLAPIPDEVRSVSGLLARRYERTIAFPCAPEQSRGRSSED